MAPTLFGLVSLLLLSSASDARSLPKSIREPLVQPVKRAASIPTTLPGNWSSFGCFSDSVDSRSLGEKSYTDTSNMTVESCIGFCSDADFIYAGIEYSQECYCGNSIASSATNNSYSDCSMACSGNSSETCGGSNRLNVFWSGQAAPSGPVTPATVGLWSSLGCYNDSAAARTLPIGMGTTGLVTVESCTTACHKAGYVLAGMEYSQECYCANDFFNNGAPASDGCTMSCAGNSTENCGGSNRLNVYAYDGAFTSSASSGSSTGTGSSSSTSSSTTAGTGTTSGSSSGTSSGTSGSSSTGATSTSTSSTSSASDATTTPHWSSLGCYTDDVANRTLTVRMGTNGDVTTESCTAACKAAGYSFAGTEYSTECYCGNALAGAGAPATSGCTMACQGNAQEMCGGANRLNVYSYGTGSTSTSSGTSTSTSSTPAASAWKTLGCYNDSTTARVLQYGPMPIDGDLTVEKCEAACTANNFVIAGVEYAAECYCDNEFHNGGAPADDGCTMPCAGDATEMCGGSYRLNVFNYVAVGGDDTGTTTTTTSSSSDSSSTTSTTTSGPTDTSTGSSDDGTSGSTSDSGSETGSSDSGSVTDIGSSTSTSSTDGSGSTSTSTSSSDPSTETGWNALGCYTDNVNSRTLGYAIGMNGANSVEACTTACYNAGYGYAGMEYSNECYCGSSIANGGGPAPDGDAQCTMACSGNASEICGGPNRLNVYNYTGTLPTPSTGNNGGGGGGADPVTGGSVFPVTSGLQSPWSYNGCWIDGANGRIMSNQQSDNSSMTVEGCISICDGLGYGIAAIEYSYQCFCSDNIINGGALASSESDCAMGCAGNATEACGGPNRMSVYANSTNVTALPVPVPQKTNLPGQWEYQGCLAEPGAVRVFPYQLILKNNNTAENCLTQCSTYGYPAGGMEYGDECWCGDVEDIAAAGGAMATESDCSMPCSGDATSICGAGNRLSYYQWTGTPLQTWHTPDNKGQYEFLIGGVVIPLITTLGTNNKVTFVEKHGTGPPNSTGAYELDLSVADNFDKAWRTMSVKTDVFCSAGLTLPDKVGRQLNIGGWSAESLFGVRLYWPDGSPGVNGTNDWQENVDELSLQRGRWYPTSIIMANGSILVVGGEDGSNGAPEPTLEILPTPAGGPTYLTMDWLQRTDPYNLYPFLFVLPSGHIFVSYYNEARILDENTFETITSLPNLPGAVNDFTGGRTYPMEGTGMLLPQYAPYTDPVTVLVCGGSTLGPAVALDNCVHIQPEVDNAQWVIERMPSKRVMSCMATLPDGTFLMVNGAHQGVAGFGLATDPNLEALLYDPTQEVGSRFSRLANTTIPRMYHSEATLLQDGRVLISGSDPEDQTYDQEYRVEVFIPPYLMAGNTQPELTITDTDWTYGSTHQFTAKLYQGGASDVRVSLLAAVSSTHGNTMNQRVLFPEVSCSGSGTVTCTVTAPPDANTSPPGWFQMFVLDGPTPSWSTWVRIGGDPASLGNWPAYDDFTVPGV